ncbi:Hypothetical predicted protein, partial [Prunus dulcis]
QWSAYLLSWMEPESGFYADPVVVNFGFSVSLSRNGYCIQPLLFYMPGKSWAFRGKYTRRQFVLTRSP